MSDIDIAALFVRRDSVYKTFDGVDCWDIDRDALNFPGGMPVVAHPPCRAWGKLRGLAKPRPGERELAFFAIEMVRRFGGVLEHPRSSLLFPTWLPYPCIVDQYGGYSICVDQFWWGHKAKKNTLLYVVGCVQNDLPDIPFSLDCVMYTIGKPKYRRSVDYGVRKEVSKAEREHTPVRLAEWLVEVARRCRV